MNCLALCLVCLALGVFFGDRIRARIVKAKDRLSR